MFQLLIDPIDVCSLSLPRIYWLSEKKFLYQKEMSIFSLFRFERNEHNHMKVKLNTKIKKNRDQSKTHIARCSCNPLNLWSACIPMQVMHAIHVMLAHQVTHTIQISLVHTLSPIFINCHQFWLGLGKPIYGKTDEFPEKFPNGLWPPPPPLFRKKMLRFFFQTGPNCTKFATKFFRSEMTPPLFWRFSGKSWPKLAF